MLLDTSDPSAVRAWFMTRPIVLGPWTEAHRPGISLASGWHWRLACLILTPEDAGHGFFVPDYLSAGPTPRPLKPTESDFDHKDDPEVEFRAALLSWEQASARISCGEWAFCWRAYPMKDMGYAKTREEAWAAADAFATSQGWLLDNSEDSSHV